MDKRADKYGIKCIYDNHQWECSSWIGSGIGFPNSLMSNHFEKTSSPESIPSYKAKKNFWDGWWNRNLQTVDGIDGWEAQATFLMDVVKLLNGRKSTFGFELLNEPPVFSISHYFKIRIYYDFLINTLRKETDKPIIFCWAHPQRLLDILPLQVRASPTSKQNVIYDCHPYPPSPIHLLYFKLTSMLIEKSMPLFIGEFNSGTEFNASLKEDQASRYVKRLGMMGIIGWAVWRWSYVKDDNIPAFNLAAVSMVELFQPPSSKHSGTDSEINLLFIIGKFLDHS